MYEAEEKITAQKLTLDATHRRLGAVMSERDGWTRPSNYGDVRAEYEAVRGAASAGLFDMSARGRIEVSGAEAVPFLNGLITNDVKTLAENSWMPAAFPNVQGRLLAHARIINCGAGLYLFDTEAATHERVRQTLARFTLAGDFHVVDRTPETLLLSLQGAQAAKIIETVLGAEASRVERGRVVQVHWRNVRVILIRATHTAEDGFALFVDPASEAGALWDELVTAGAHPVGDEAHEILRIEAGEPRYGIDVSDTNVVLEAALDDAVSFTKGCYLGQEIIARIHWRGHVAKRLTGLVLDDEQTEGVPRAAKLKTADGKEIGRITSSVFSPRLRRAVALGLVKYDYLQAGTEVQVAGAENEEARTAHVADLPLVRGSWWDAQAHDGSPVSG